MCAGFVGTVTRCNTDHGSKPRAEYILVSLAEYKPIYISPLRKFVTFLSLGYYGIQASSLSHGNYPDVYKACIVLSVSC
jgi:hypothetical protein